MPTPGMWQYTVRGSVGVAKAAHLGGDAIARDEALGRARIRWDDVPARRDMSNSSVGCQTAYDYASCLAAIGDDDGALELLEFALDHGWACLPQLRSDPAFARMREDPRLAAFIDRCPPLLLGEPGYPPPL